MPKKPDPSTKTPPAGSRSPGPEDPFLYEQVTLPSRRMRMPLRVPLHAGQKRILVLVAIALVLAVIGAVVGTVLLTRPRKVRTTVRADLRALDDRIGATVRCLGGAKARPDGSDLPPRLWTQALGRADWPRVIRRCHQQATRLLSTASAVNASAHAAPSRVPKPIRAQYEKALDAAGAVQRAVASLAAEARAGHRLPAWPTCLDASRAVGQFQLVLGAVERLAELSGSRQEPAAVDRAPPRWSTPAALAPSLDAPPGSRLAPLHRRRAPRALRLRLPGGRAPLLLVDPAGRARWVALPARPPAGASPKGSPRAASGRPGLTDAPVTWVDVLPDARGGTAKDSRGGTAKDSRGGTAKDSRGGTAKDSRGATRSPSPRRGAPRREKPRRPSARSRAPSPEAEGVELLWTRSGWLQPARRGVLQMGLAALPEESTPPPPGARPHPKSRPRPESRAGPRRSAPDPRRAAPKPRRTAAGPRRAVAGPRRAAAGPRRAAAEPRRAAAEPRRAAAGPRRTTPPRAKGRMLGSHPLRWPPRVPVAPRVHAGWLAGDAWHLLASAPHGGARELVYVRWPHSAVRRPTGDGGSGRVRALATDLGDPGSVTLWWPRGPRGHGPVVTYPVRGGGTAVQRLSAGDASPPARSVLGPGTSFTVEALCASQGHTYLLADTGELWAAPAPSPTARFRRVSWPGRAGRQRRMTCAEGKAALAWRHAKEPTFHYATCDPRGCGEPRRVSWSRLRAVALLPTAGGVLVLAAERRLLFGRLDPGVDGTLEAPRPVTRWKRPPDQWLVLRGGAPTHLTLLLLDGRLSRLRSTDGGLTWVGQ